MLLNEEEFEGVEDATDDGVIELSAFELVAILLTSGLFAVLLGVVGGPSSDDAPPHPVSTMDENSRNRLIAASFFVCTYIC